jgi:hypothetical protein
VATWLSSDQRGVWDDAIRLRMGGTAALATHIQPSNMP